MLRMRCGEGPILGRLALAAALAGLAWPAAGLAQAAGPALGIDISHHSGEIDWSVVAEHGYAFIYVKATEGVDDADPKFEEHWQRLGELGIARGAYHFYVTEDDPEEQAHFFLSRARPQPGDLAPVVDIELIGRDTSGELAPKLRRFLEIVEERVGAPPIIYTDTKFWDAHLDASFGKYPLWVAEYDVEAPTVPEGWSGWALWQFQGDAEVPGIEKGADESRIHPELSLDALRLGAPAGGGG